MLSKSKRPFIVNPECTIGRDKCRWIENASRGWRLVGLAHELDPRGVQHKGRFTRSDDFAEVFVGIVYRLPAVKGRNRYLIGYADPDNADCALISCEVFSSEHGGECGDALAGRAADEFARVHAEREREYQDAWFALSDARRALSKAHQEARAAIAEVRELRTVAMVNPNEYAKACETAEEARAVFSRARSRAACAAAYAQRHHNIGWREASF